MRFFLLLLSCFVLTRSYSQDFSKVDSIVNKYPRYYTSPDKLAALINKDFKTQPDKARAIFTWVAGTVQFDVKEANKKVVFKYATEEEKIAKEKKYKRELVLKALREHKTTNRGYAWLYETLCTSCGLECVIISGYLKSSPDDISQLPTTINHLWNAVKIDGKWNFVDTTIAAGSVDANEEFKAYFNDGYFFTAPDVFFLNHYPSNEKWLLIEKNKQDFASLPLFYGDYVKATYKIVSPALGHMDVAENNTVSFKIEGLDPSAMVSYFTDGKNQKEFMQQNETTQEYTAIVDKNVDKYITLYINDKLIATYRLI
jgi:transglutaminase/protease-like cytokinesis protein 3